MEDLIGGCYLWGYCIVGLGWSVGVGLHNRSFVVVLENFSLAACLTELSYKYFGSFLRFEVKPES